EQHKLTLLRSGLLRQREANVRRGAAAPVGVKLGGRPRTSVPGPIAAENSQTALRQAIMSGQPVTQADRVNAAPDVKEQVERAGRTEAIRWVLSRTESTREQGRDKGRSGGGRGR